MPFEPIYREYSCNLSQANCTKLLQALAICKGTITCNFTLAGGRGLSEKTVNRWTMFFKLRFDFQADLDKFHQMGFVTTEPMKIAPPIRPTVSSDYRDWDYDVS